LIAYSMIVDKNKMGKGSWTQLLSPNDMKDFNDFVRSVNPDNIELDVDTYRKVSTGGFSQGLKFNTIPYTFKNVKEEGNGITTASDIREREPVQMQLNVVDEITRLLPSNYSISSTKGILIMES